MVNEPVFMGVHLAVADMELAAAFYRRVGLTIEAGAEANPHLEAVFASGAHLALSTSAVIAMYDPAWRGHAPATAAVLQLGLGSREAVDAMFDDLTALGHHGHLPPIDAFWGSRYCEVDDPDGHVVGFHSPREFPRGQNA